MLTSGEPGVGGSTDRTQPIFSFVISHAFQNYLYTITFLFDWCHTAAELQRHLTYEYDWQYSI